MRSGDRGGSSNKRVVQDVEGRKQVTKIIVPLYSAECQIVGRVTAWDVTCQRCHYINETLVCLNGVYRPIHRFRRNSGCRNGINACVRHSHFFDAATTIISRIHFHLHTHLRWGVTQMSRPASLTFFEFQDVIFNYF